MIDFHRPPGRLAGRFSFGLARARLTSDNALSLVRGRRVPRTSDNPLSLGSVAMPDTVVFPNEGRIIVAKWWRGESRQPHHFYSYHLFKNFVAPFDRTLTLARLERCDFMGYQAVQFQFKDTSAPALQAGEVRFMLGVPTPSFVQAAGTQTVKGFWVQDNHSSKILLACLFEEPITLDGPARLNIDVQGYICGCETEVLDP